MLHQPRSLSGAARIMPFFSTIGSQENNADQGGLLGVVDAHGAVAAVADH